MTEEKIHDRLRKLKAHADSAASIGSEAEADAFARKLAELLAQHNLNMSDIEWEKEVQQDPAITFWYSKKTKLFEWEVQLASIVAKANQCKILIGGRRGRRSFASLCFTGQKLACETCVETMNYMHPAAVKISQREYDKRYAQAYDNGDSTEHLKGYRGSFLFGFVVRLKERFDEDQKRREASSSVALVRISQALKLAERGVEKFGGGPKREGGQFTPQNMLGALDGRRKANDVNIGGPTLSQGVTGHLKGGV